MEPIGETLARLKRDAEIMPPPPTTIRPPPTGPRVRAATTATDLTMLTPSKRRRSRSRSRSPDRRDRYEDSRSRSRDRYRGRERSPTNGHYESRGYGGDRSRTSPQIRSNEERSQNKAEMMNNIKESSQQDRRVYVGNLPYDVKWHGLKDFMKEGTFYQAPHFTPTTTADTITAGDVLFADVLLLPNGMSKVIGVLAR